MGFLHGVARGMAMKLESVILRRAGEAGHAKVAVALGKDASTVSRIFAGAVGVSIHDMQAFFDAMGLCVSEIGGETVVISRQKYEALMVLARESLRFSGDEN